MTRHALRLTITLSLASSLSFAQGEPTDPGAAPTPVTTTSVAPAPQPVAPSLEVSLKAGVHLPQLMNPLQTSFDAVLKVGYALPFLERRLQLFVDLGYTQPEVTVKGEDARVAGGTFSSTTILRDFAMSFGACFFILEPSRPLVPYVSAGARVHFLLAETNGSAGGAELGKYQETDTRFGGVFAAGAGYRLGPGRVLLELAINVLPLEQRLMGTSNASSLSIVAGYGLFF